MYGTFDRAGSRNAEMLNTTVVEALVVRSERYDLERTSPASAAGRTNDQRA